MSIFFSPTVPQRPYVSISQDFGHSPYPPTIEPQVAAADVWPPQLCDGVYLKKKFDLKFEAAATFPMLPQVPEIKPQVLPCLSNSLE